MVLTDKQRKFRDMLAAGHYIIHDVKHERFTWTNAKHLRAIHPKTIYAYFDDLLLAYIETDVKSSQYRLIGPGKCMLIKLKSCKKLRG